MTGNRPQKIPFAENSKECEELKQRMRDVTESLILEGYTQFYTGMAQGVDIWFAECVLDLQDIYPDIELIAAIPYTGQRDRLSISDRFRYDRIVDRCVEVHILSETYTKYCMSKRNRFMVDNSDVLLVVSYGESGGTVNTRAYAEKKNKRIIDLV